MARAVRSARSAEPGLDVEGVVGLVADTSGVPARLVRGAIEYWVTFPAEIDGWIVRADSEAAEAENRWHREQAILGR
ncbi:MAG: hypothetical protein ACR2F6_15095 [Mycobacteriales bacterium]